MYWKFYSERKKLTLENFLEGIETLDEALLKFKEMEIEPPHKELINFFASKNLKKDIVQKERRPKKKVNVKINTNDTEPQAKSEYFRKVIKKD